MLEGGSEVRRGDTTCFLHRSLNQVFALDSGISADYSETGKGAYFSQPNSAATPTSAVRSSDRRSLPLPGAVRVRSVARYCVAYGKAGCRAEGKSGTSSEDDMRG